MCGWCRRAWAACLSREGGGFWCLSPRLTGCLLCAARRGRYSYIDFMRYSWGAVMVNQFSGHDLPFNGIPGSPTVLEHYALKCGPPAASRPCARGA